MKVGPVSNESMQGEGEVEVGGEPGSETGAADHEHGPVPLLLTLFCYCS